VKEKLPGGIPRRHGTSGDANTFVL
jgi:hypothetical protein